MGDALGAATRTADVGARVAQLGEIGARKALVEADLLPQLPGLFLAELAALKQAVQAAVGKPVVVACGIEPGDTVGQLGG